MFFVKKISALFVIGFGLLMSLSEASLTYNFTSGTAVAVTASSYSASGTLSLSLGFAPPPELILRWLIIRVFLLSVALLQACLREERFRLLIMVLLTIMSQITMEGTDEALCCNGLVLAWIAGEIIRVVNWEIVGRRIDFNLRPQRPAGCWQVKP